MSRDIRSAKLDLDAQYEGFRQRSNARTNRFLSSSTCTKTPEAVNDFWCGFVQQQATDFDLLQQKYSSLLGCFLQADTKLVHQALGKCQCICTSSICILAAVPLVTLCSHACTMACTALRHERSQADAITIASSLCQVCNTLNLQCIRIASSRA